MKLVDQYGNPFDSAILKEPQTARIALLDHAVVDSQLDGLTPARAGRILREADNGDLTAQHQLFDDMLDRDAHLRCEFDKRQSAPLTLDWHIEAPVDASRAEKKAAAFAEAMLRDTVDDLEDVILSLMEAVGHGFATVELEWQRWGGEWLPTFHPRPQTWFQTDLNRRELRLIDGSGQGAALIPFGWIMHQHKKVKTGYLGRMGLLRTLIWPFLYKAYAIGDFAEFLETYGLPIIVGKYMQGATNDEKSSLLRSVAALGHDARAIMPENMAIEIEKVSGSGDGNQHLAMVSWADGAQSKALLGQVLSAEAKATGMGSGVADLHAEVRRDILAADARQIAGTLTRDLIYPLLVLNGAAIDSYRRCPRWVFDLGKAEDMKAFADALPVLAAGGAQIPVSWVHEKLRIPQAADGEAVFGSSPLSLDGRGAGGRLAGFRKALLCAASAGLPCRANPGEGAAAASALNRTRLATLAALAAPATTADQTDPADQITGPLADATQPVINDWLATIERLLADNPDLTPVDIQQRLLQMFGDLPTEQLVEIMAQGYALAAMVGMDDVNGGQ
ncbi:MAG: DUF935 domain-containing protein [Azonexus sp.]|jgi:phage gp29-like protein|nr:DUF935 domain-containing protein [Azonexus sp.]